MSPGRVLAVGGALVALALALVLTHSDHRVTGSNYTSRDAFVVEIKPGETACQDRETVHARSGRIEIRSGTYAQPGPPLRAETFRESGERVQSGRLAGGWKEGDVQIPLGPAVDDRITGARICLTNEGSDRIAVAGQPAKDFGATIGGALVGGKMRFDYYTAGEESLLSTLPQTIEHFGVGKARRLGGTWTLLPLLAALIAAVAIATRLVLRPPASDRGLAVGCALVALCSALSWSLLTPPLHVPDEVAHYAYAQHLGETGRLPVDQPGADLPPDTAEVTAALNFFAVISDPHDKPIRADEEEAVVREVEAKDLPTEGNGEALSANLNPPLYYAASAALYQASPARDMLDRLAVMRLLSVLLAALTAALVVLFILEVAPGNRAAALGGGLAASLQPLFGFIGGGVNNDNLLYVFAAALFLVIARAFRRGLTPRRGAEIGLVIAFGLLTKLTFIGLIPGALAALAVLAWRARFSRPALTGVALTFACLAPYVLYRLIEPGWREDATGPSDAVPHQPRDRREMLSYIWQLYLPRLPFMNDLLPEFPAYNLWFVGWVGRFGWLDYSFPGWVNQGALLVLALLVALVARALWRERDRLLARRAEFLTYAFIAVFFLGTIGAAGHGYREDTGEPFEQARYLLPLLPLFGALVAVALRGLGRRALAGAAVVAVLGSAHLLFSQLLTVDRYFA